MVKFKVNGEARAYDGDPSMPLLWYLRDDLKMTGTKYGCGEGFCGACTVHVDGKVGRACVVAMAALEGVAVVTIEGLDPQGNHPVQKAWRELSVPQCGYCQAGQIMSAAALLASNKKPSDDQIREAMDGNICRCGCYQRIIAAVRLTANGA